MDNKDHATILNGYFSRLTISQRNRIIEADNKVIYAQLNLGNAAQIEAQSNKQRIIEKIMDEMIPSDLVNMETIITRAIKEEGDLKVGVL